jgi:pimeloyl-ACP methyl ester carboxylesterase
MNPGMLVALAVMNLLTVTWCFEGGTTAAKGQEHPTQAEEKYFDLGGYRLHALLAGQGKPVVVFEAGMGDGTDSWEKVQPKIAQLTRTLSYDRPGLGKSDRAPELHDLNQSADELHALLQKSGSRPPYVLVGHSMGGLIVRVFAYRYPSETAGIVLVDPADEGTDDRLHSKLTKEQWESYRAFMKKHLQIPIMHIDMYGMTSGSEAAAAVPLPSVPKILLSASKLDGLSDSDKPFREAAMELHREWVQKTPNAELVAVPTSEHYIQIVAPETVIAAIRKILTEIKR